MVIKRLIDCIYSNSNSSVRLYFRWKKCYIEKLVYSGGVIQKSGIKKHMSLSHLRIYSCKSRKSRENSCEVNQRRNKISMAKKNQRNFADNQHKLKSIKTLLAYRNGWQISTWTFSSAARNKRFEEILKLQVFFIEICTGKMCACVCVRVYTKHNNGRRRWWWRRNNVKPNAMYDDVHRTNREHVCIGRVIVVDG